MSIVLQKVVVGVGVAVAVAIVGWGTGWGTGDARACMREVEAPSDQPAKPNPPQIVASAESAVDRGEAKDAVNAVARVFKNLKTAPDRLQEADPLERRAVRIMALAAVRSDGAVGITTGSGAKAQNLEWSVSALRKLNALRATDASLQADLGEALAKVPASQKEAFELLSKLATNDVLGSAYAYAALARLYSADGNIAKSNEAVQRCRAMTVTPSICVPSATTSKPTVPSPPAREKRA